MLARRIHMMRRQLAIALLCGCSLSVLILSTSASAVPPMTNYQAYLTDEAGLPRGGVYPMTFAIFDAPTGGSPSWSESHSSVSVTGGVFSVILGSVTPLPEALFSGPVLWLETAIDDTVLTPRRPLVTVPYAFRAAAAETALVAITAIAADTLWQTNGTDVFRLTGSVGIGTTSPSAELDVAGTAEVDGLRLPAGAVSGHVLTSDANGLASWQAGNGGDITGVTAGSGLTGGGTSGTVTLNANFAGSGSATSVSRSDHNHTGTYVLVADLDHLDASDGSPQNAVLVDAVGNVGIGTTAPARRLHVQLSSTSNEAVRVEQTSTGTGLLAMSNAVLNSRPAVYGQITTSSGGGVGVRGDTPSPGDPTGSTIGVYGQGTSTAASVGGAALGVLGRVHSVKGGAGTAVPVGVFGDALSTSGVAWGVTGESWGTDPSSCGVKGKLRTSGAMGRAVWGETAGTPPSLTDGWAGYFDGRVNVTGTLSKGGGSFRIDHPLDPTNKYLQHSFVESPEMMNIYNGNVQLDPAGEATVALPEWFDALNSDFRYQLTAIGAPGAGLYVAEEVVGNRFRIAGGAPGGKVSWQVTGIRKDPFAEKYRIQIEEDKPEQERGKYLHPEAYGVAPEMGIGFDDAPVIRLAGSGSE
jgi:hypothetical protein